MLRIVKAFWDAVRRTFPEAWDEPPRRSRLVHGVGIVSLGSVMDEITYALRHEGELTSDRYHEQLQILRDVCHWTSGVWDFAPDDQRRWNELQNTPRDIKVLSDYLLRTYRTRTSRRSRLVAA